MEINFDLKRSEISRRVEAEALVFPNYFNNLKTAFKFLTIIFLILLLLFAFRLRQLENRLLSGLILSFVLWYFFEIQFCFFNSKIKNPDLKVPLKEALEKPHLYNLAEYLDFDLAKVLKETEKTLKENKLSEITPILFLFTLKKLNHPLFLFVFSKLAIKEEFGEFIDKSFSLNQKETSLDFKKIIFDSLTLALNKGKERAGVGEMLVVCFKTDPLLSKFLIEKEIKENDISDLVFLYESSKRKLEESKKFWKYENLLKLGSIGKDWSAGYTYYLNQFSTDLTEEIKKWVFKEIIGHQKEIVQTERILSREKINNVLIVGEPGTGRESIIEAIAYKCFFGDIHPALKYHRVVKLDLISLFSFAEEREKGEALLDKVFKEVLDAGNVILVIDNLHNYLGIGQKQTQSINIVPILSRYLNFSQFRFIGITDFTSLHTVLEQFPSFLALFEKVEVEEVSREETLEILTNSALELEQKNKILITYPALREIVNLTERYFPTIPFPQKALGVLDEVVVYVLNMNEKIVLSKHVATIISEKVEIPIGEIQKREKEILLHLEEFLHKRVIDQEEAIKEVSNALRRARSGIEVSRKKPIGSFLFLGPTGVGKTETAKALAEMYFGKEENMIRLDMSEFQRVEDIVRLLGKPGEEGLLTTSVREKPFSLLLLDEIEKTHPNLLNLFLQVFDEGWITDGQGRKVIFTHNIIIGTSNAGSELIWEALAQKKDFSVLKENLVQFLLKKGIFKPEFINRLDAVVIFKPLEKEDLLKISELKLSKLKEGLKEKGIELEITEELKEKIVELSYKPEFGAREMNRVIQDKVENVLAKAILADKLKRGDRVKINPTDFSLIINY